MKITKYPDNSSYVDVSSVNPTKPAEMLTVRDLLEKYPNGIVSIVSDTFDLWNVCTNILPTLKDQILARDGKLVIRPDSGDPVDIICGGRQWKNVEEYEFYSKTSTWKATKQPHDLGVIELLWDIFGGITNEQGYKVLDPHIGVIYGDSITLERCEEICERLKAKGFASTNVEFLERKWNKLDKL